MFYELLPEQSLVLELGSGPGNDLALLSSRYQVIGSDESPAFVDLLKARFPDLNILQLDAATIDTDGPFDAVFSNKVLHHLSDVSLAHSFRRQAEILRTGGISYHLIWCRLEVPEETHGLIYQARDQKAMSKALGPGFELLEYRLFGEFEEGDSLIIAARKT